MRSLATEMSRPMAAAMLAPALFFAAACSDSGDDDGAEAGADSIINPGGPDIVDGAGSSGGTTDETGAGTEGDDGTGDDSSLPGAVLPAYDQRPGDPDAGFEALAYKGYVGCGLPKTVYTLAQGQGTFSGAPLPGRDNDVPYFLTEYTNAAGDVIVGPNCMSCHADTLNGEVVIGLGSTNVDFGGLANQAGALKGLLPQAKPFLNETEFAELSKFVERMSAIAPFVQPLTTGVNSADNLAAVLFAHRDPITLAWSDEPLMDLPPDIVVPLDVPPWWRMAKKHTMLYSAGGRGDHARIMMAASTLCVDSVEEAETIDAWFPDVRAYIYSLQAPAWPWAKDDALAAEGRQVFTTHCAICHGTYDEGAHTYPNLIIDLDVVGTDNSLGLGAAQLVDRFIDWFNASFYGEISWLDPQPGYVPPPLDGIWATAPFLHNGSVPTLAALLDSSKRPTYWKRESFGNINYDADALGWPYIELETGQDDEPNSAKRRLIYDTTKLGYGNGGHNFGDVLTDEERNALMEYLKTL